jgi:hypothetical protein
MIPSWKAPLVGLLALTLSAGPVLAYDAEQAPRNPTADEMFVDAIYGRPLGLVSIVLGAFAFTIALPFTLTSHSVGDSAKTLVGGTTQYTFKRPLGRFITCDEQPDMCK